MQSFTTTSPRGETRWKAQPDLAGELLAADGLRLKEWRVSGCIETVKSGSHRAVYRLTLASGCYYLKHYRAGDWKAVLQNAIRPPRAILEWNAARQIADVGISTIDTVAVGCTVRHGLTFDSYLVCRSIENTLPLDEFIGSLTNDLPDERRNAIRRRLAASLGRLVAALHRHRIIHRDLHAENVLVRLQPDDSVRLWLIDLHAVALCRRLTLRQIERNLALLNPALVHNLTPVDRTRFFRSYWKALLSTNDLPGGWIPAIASLDRRAVSHRIADYCRHDLERVQRRRDRKWADGNRRLIIADSKDVFCRGLAQLGREQLLAIRDRPESLLSAAAAQPLSTSTQPPSRLVSLRCGDESIACRFQTWDEPPVGRWRLWQSGQSAPRRAWEIGHALLRRDIPTPRPLAYVERGGGDTHQYLLTAHVPHAVPLESWLKQNGPEQGARLSRIAIPLGRALRRLHAAGFAYTSLNAASILVADDESEIRLWFDAAQNLRRSSRTSNRNVKTSLAELLLSLRTCCEVSQSNLVRFLRRFLGEQFTREWKSLWRDVQSLSSGSPAASTPVTVESQPGNTLRKSA